MSYEIIYGKQFVKLSGGRYIPMLLDGSNNCTQLNRKGYWVRERSWKACTWFTGREDRTPTGQAILDGLIEEINKTVKEYSERENRDAGDTPENIRNHFGYYTSLAFSAGNCGALSAEKLINFFRNGIQKAKTIEELAAAGVYIRFYHYKWDESEYTIPEPEAVTIKTEKEFLRQLAIRQKWMKETRVKSKTGELSTVGMDIRFSGDYESVLDNLKRLRPEKQIREKKSVEIDHYFTLRNEQGYLVRYTSRGYKYAYYLCSRVKIFETEKQAEVFRRKLVNSGKHLAETWKVQRIDQKTTIRKAA